MNMTHVRYILAAWLCVLGGGALFGGAVAQARVAHPFEKAFGSEGSGPGQFKKPTGVAVNDVTHDVYVVDTGNNRVQEFNSSGSTVIGEFNGSGSPTGVFSEPTQIAVDDSGNPLDPSAGDVYVVDGNHHVVDKFSETGVYIGQLTGTTCETPPNIEEVVPCPKTGVVHLFQELKSVAVDPAGELWVQDQEPNFPRRERIENFSDGQPNQPIAVRQTSLGANLSSGLSVDAEDNIYLFANGGDYKVNSRGELLVSPFCGGKNKFFQEEFIQTEPAFGVALDGALGQVYLDYKEGRKGEYGGRLIGVCGLAGDLIESFGSGYLTDSRGVAVDASSGESNSGTVYASDATADRVVIFAAVALPTVSVMAPSEQRPRSLTLNGAVNPEGHAVTGCVFEYDTVPYSSEGEGPHGTQVACSPGAGSVGGGSAPVHVSAQVSGLEPEKTYYYRLVAENAASAIAGPSRSVGREVFAGPILGGEYVTGVTSGSATLAASLDANGGDTHYFFEYGPSSGYGAFAPVEPPGADIGSAVGAQALSVHLQGLQPGVAYHYRLVAEQDGELFEESDRVFTTEMASASGTPLPDGRAWELVSPATKPGTVIDFFVGFSDDIQAAADGSGIYYDTLNQLGEGVVGKGVSSDVLSSRGGAGWRSRDLTLPDVLPPEGDEPANGLGGAEYLRFSPDLSSAIVEPHRFTPPLAPGVSERTLYLRDLSLESSFAPLVTSENTPAGTRYGVEKGVRPDGGSFVEPMRVYAANPDLSSLVVSSPVALTEGGYSELYEWRAGTLAPVGVLPNNTRYEHAMSVAGQGAGIGGTQRAVSDDGRWVAWTAGSPYATVNVPLYVRDMVEERTMKVGGANPRYQTMSSDGSKVFYLENGDLYLFETETETSTDLTLKHGVGETSAGVREAVSDVSEDGSYVYFVATGVLAPDAVAGQPNLYELHESEGAWSEPTLVATLSFEDEPSWYEQAFGAASGPALAYVSSRVSPNGRYLAFMSERSLTGYDNRDAASGQPDEEVYLYDAVAGRLVCASCNPTGARPRGVLDKSGSEPLVDRRGIWSRRNLGSHAKEHWLAGSVPGWDEGVSNRSMYQPRYLSNSGRLFFDSPDALVALATNGLEDVYEYEPPDVGGCTVGAPGFSENANGCVDLISSGISGKESAFFDASENGDDVFFITAARLVGEDRDTAYDIYDAHVCGAQGVPCRQEPVSPPACTNEESCRAAPSPQPAIFGAPPSATFAGVGNLVVPSSAAAGTTKKTVKKKTARCVKGKKLSHGRCVKTKKKKSKVTVGKSSDAGRVR